MTDIQDRNIRGYVAWMSIALLVIAADQATKWAIVEWLPLYDKVRLNSFVNLTHQQNTGAAFSFLANAGGWQRWFFILLALGFGIYLIMELAKLPRDEKALGWVFSLILGGAMGNMYDRLTDGNVVDFVLVHYREYYFPAFNVADSALFCGAAFWVLLMLLEWRAERSKRDVV